MTSNRIGRLATALPLTSRATTTTRAWELPSWAMVSGVAAIVSESDSSDGPVMLGAGASSTEQPAARATAARRDSV